MRQELLAIALLLVFHATVRPVTTIPIPKTTKDTNRLPDLIVSARDDDPFLPVPNGRPSCLFTGEQAVEVSSRHNIDPIKRGCYHRNECDSYHCNQQQSMCMVYARKLGEMGTTEQKTSVNFGCAYNTYMPNTAVEIFRMVNETAACYRDWPVPKHGTITICVCNWDQCNRHARLLDWIANKTGIQTNAAINEPWRTSVGKGRSNDVTPYPAEQGHVRRLNVYYIPQRNGTTTSEDDYDDYMLDDVAVLKKKPGDTMTTVVIILICVVMTMLVGAICALFMFSPSEQPVDRDFQNYQAQKAMDEKRASEMQAQRSKPKNDGGNNRTTVEVDSMSVISDCRLTAPGPSHNDRNLIGSTERKLAGRQKTTCFRQAASSDEDDDFNPTIAPTRAPTRQQPRHKIVHVPVGTNQRQSAPANTYTVAQIKHYGQDEIEEEEETKLASRKVLFSNDTLQTTAQHQQGSTATETLAEVFT